MIHEQVKKWRKVIKYRIKYGMRLGNVGLSEFKSDWSVQVYPPAGSGLSVETMGSRRRGFADNYGMVFSMVFKKDKLELI